MGIFSEYGIEYAIKLKDSKIIVLVPIKNTDKKLLASKYYQIRKEYYTTNAYSNQWREKIVDSDCELFLIFACKNLATLGSLASVPKGTNKDFIPYSFFAGKKASNAC